MVHYSISRYSTLSKKERNKTISPKQLIYLNSKDDMNTAGGGGGLEKLKSKWLAALFIHGYFYGSKLAHKEEDYTEDLNG
jgi:hypothetical protein